MRCCDPADLLLVQGSLSCQGDVNVPCINQLHGMRHEYVTGREGKHCCQKRTLKVPFTFGP